MVEFLKKDIEPLKKDDFFGLRFAHSLTFELIAEKKTKPFSKEIIIIKDLLKIPPYSRENPEMIQQLHDVEKMIINQNLIDDLVRLDFNFVLFKNGLRFYRRFQMMHIFDSLLSIDVLDAQQAFRFGDAGVRQSYRS